MGDGNTKRTGFFLSGLCTLKGTLILTLVYCHECCRCSKEVRLQSIGNCGSGNDKSRTIQARKLERSPQEPWKDIAQRAQGLLSTSQIEIKARGGERQDAAQKKGVIGSRLQSGGGDRLKEEIWCCRSGDATCCLFIHGVFEQIADSWYFAPGNYVPKITIWSYIFRLCWWEPYCCLKPELNVRFEHDPIGFQLLPSAKP